MPTYTSSSDHPFLLSGVPVKAIGTNVQPVWGPTGTSTWPQIRYNQIKAKGFTTVRFVLHWDDMQSAQGVFYPDALTALDTAVARATTAGLLIVMSPIYFGGGGGGLSRVPSWGINGDSVTTMQSTPALDYEKAIATRYTGQLLGIDLVNEPFRYPLDPTGVLQAYNTMIGAVRTVDPNVVILIEPTYGDTLPLNANWSVLTNRTNVAWTWHNYYAGGAGNGYESDGRQVAGHYSWDGTTGYLGTKADLEAHAAAQLHESHDLGNLATWVGEMGVGNTAPGRDALIRDQVSVFKSHGLDYTWWEYYATGTTASLSSVDSSFNFYPQIDLLFPASNDRATSDSLSVTDALAVTVKRTRTATDGVGVNDALTYTDTGMRVIPGNVNIPLSSIPTGEGVGSPVVTVIGGTLLVQPNGIVTGESFGSATVTQTSLPSSINPTGISTGFQSGNHGVFLAAPSIDPDSITLSDAVLADLGKNRTTVDALSLFDGISRYGKYPRATGDSFGITDGVVYLKIAGRNTGDILSVNDGVPTRWMGYGRNLNATSTVTEVLSWSLKTKRSLADSVAISDQVLRSMWNRRSAQDLLIVSEIPSRLVHRFRSPSDSVALTDLLDMFHLIVRSSGEAITLTDSPQRLTQTYRAQGESILISDLLVRRPNFMAGVSDSISISEIVDRLRTVIAATADIVGISEVEINHVDVLGFDPIPYNFVVWKGADFTKKIKLLSGGPGSLPKDLSNNHLTLTIKSSINGNTLLTLSDVSGGIYIGANGTFTIDIPGTDTALLGWRIGNYQLRLSDPAGRVNVLMYGTFSVSGF